MIDLACRDRGIRELMDDPDADLAALRRTYGQFRLVNRLLSGWRQRYRQDIRPLLSADRETTLLDVGCGGGDVARALAGWAARDRLRLRITGVDPDPRAYAYALGGGDTEHVDFRCCSSTDLVTEGRQFDVVISNHLLHHLDDSQLSALLADCEVLARRHVLHNDLARSRVAYAAYGLVSRPAGSSSFLRTDGLRSIRRSYRRGELAAVVPNRWQVRHAFPFRLLLRWAADG
ncbi:MAG TPA: class I SAM-dependent methyltransferase [Propionibacteriaceae bacterium]|nr:class I SAM-dependent methyltransferase [Propionibacteriaceae bacterium]